MNAIVLKEPLAKQFVGAQGPTELRDEQGKLLGTFTPHRAREVVVPFSEDELDEFESEDGGRSLQAILADLEDTR